jgi:hypothetical protein
MMTQIAEWRRVPIDAVDGTITPDSPSPEAARS